MVAAHRTSIVLAATLAMIFVGGPSNLVATGSPAGPVDDGEPVISGDAWIRARDAALAAIPGGGRVTETEVGDEDSFYEVEVTLQDGRTIDVQLDTTFRGLSPPTDAELVDDGRGRGESVSAVT